MTSTYDADALAAALHEAAEFVAAHADLPRPYITSSFTGRAHVSFQLMNVAADDQRAALRAVARAIGGKWTKSAGSEDFYLSQVIGRLDFTISATRSEVCERRVVGTETVTLPAVEAKPERTEEREVVEWDCSPVLAPAEVSA